MMYKVGYNIIKQKINPAKMIISRGIAILIL